MPLINAFKPILFSSLFKLTLVVISNQCFSADLEKAFTVERVFGPNMIDIKIGSGPPLKIGDFVSARISRQTLSENNQVLDSNDNGYELVIVGKHSNLLVNEAMLGNNAKGPMCSRNAIRRIHHTSKTPIVGFLVEVSNMMYHLPIPQ